MSKLSEASSTRVTGFLRPVAHKLIAVLLVFLMSVHKFFDNDWWIECLKIK